MPELLLAKYKKDQDEFIHSYRLKTLYQDITRFINPNQISLQLLNGCVMNYINIP